VVLVVVVAARQVYMEEIMDWTDNFKENLANEPETSQARKQAIEKISRLWVEYALMESSLRQFKKAQQVFDNALVDPIAGKCALLYMEYANYSYKERGKLANAQKVYVKGVTAADMPVTATDTLWAGFLQLMRSQATTSTMTLEQLVEEVSKSVPTGTTVSQPSSSINLSAAAVPVLSSESIESKSSLAAPSQSGAQCSPKVPETSSAAELEPLDDTQGMTPEVLFKRHFKRLPTIMAAPGQEPLVSGLRNLDAAELNELGLYFNQSCGPEHAHYLSFVDESQVLSRVREARQCPDASRYNLHQRDCYSPVLRLEVVLDVLEACWVVQALKERHFDSWFSDLFKIHSKEVSER
jgi:hypothetical protein